MICQIDYRNTTWPKGPQVCLSVSQDTGMYILFYMHIFGEFIHFVY